MANRYWVGGTAQWTASNTALWSASSGGASGASVPTASDSVFFDQAGPYTVTMGNFTLNCLDFTISGASVTIAGVAGPPQLNIYGSFSIVSTTVWSATQIVVNFVATTTGNTINTNGVTVNFNGLNFNGAGGGWTLSGALTTGTSCTTTLTAGSLDIAGFTFSTGLFSSNNSNTRSIAFGVGFIALTTTSSGQTVLQMSTITNFSSTGTGGFSSATNVTKTFSSGITAGGSQTTGPSMFVTAGAGVITLNGSSYWNTLSFVGSTSTVNSVGNATLVYATNLILGSGTSHYINATPTFNMTVKGNAKGLSGTLTVNNAAVTFTWDTSGGTCFASTTILSAGKIACTGGGTIGSTTGTTMAHSGGELAINGCTWRNLTYTYTGGTITDTGGGTIRVSDNVGNNGTFTLNGPTLSLPISPTTSFIIDRRFVLTAGAITVTANTSMTTAGVSCIVEFAAGTITLNNYNLTLGQLVGTTIASVYSTAARTINFGTGYIYCSVVTMAVADNITLTGAGGFGPPGGVASVATGFQWGTTSGASISMAPNIYYASGATASTLTTGSWFNKLDFGASAFTLTSTIVNLNTLILGSGTYTLLTATMRGTGTLTTNSKPCILVINNDVNTTTLTAAANAATFTMTAGTIDFATFNLTCTTTATYTNGTLSNIGTITCTTFTVSTGTFTLTSGNITPSTSVVISSNGTFNYNNGTLGSVATFTQTLGTMNFNKAYSLTTTGLYTLTAGSLTLNGFVLTVGRFASTNTNTRSISFGSGNIIMSTTNTGQVCLDMATTTNFSCTGTGGFTSPMSTARTFQFGTTGGSSSIAPNLTLTSGISAPTFTTSSWFNKLDFSGTTGGTIPATTTVNVNSLTLAAAGTYTNLTVNVVGTGTIISNGNTTIVTLVINVPGGTVSAGDAFTTNTASGAITLTAGTFNLNGYNPTLGAFISSNTNTRSVSFGANSIILALTSGTCLNMPTATNFTWTGTGGFSVASGAARITNFGSVAGGTSSNAPNLTITGSAALTFNLTANSWYNKVDFGTSAVIISTLTVNFNSITASTSVTYTGLTSIMQGTGTIITNGRTFGPITINHSGTTTLGDALTTNSTTTMTTGTLNLAGFTMTTPTLSSSSSSARSITGAGNLIVTGSWSVSDGTNFTGNNYTINMTSASGKTFDGGGGSYGNLVQAGAGALTISGSNQLNNISANTRPSTISFTAGTTQTLTNFTLSGTVGNLVTINSVTLGTQFNLRKTSDTVNVNYLTISDSNASAAFFANTNSTNSGNNTGWNFTTPVVVQAGFAAFF
jgi:hypothetical protein